MPGKTDPQTCTSCIPPRTLSALQDFNRHILAFHRDEPLQLFCGMVENGVLCSVRGCTNPIYKASGQKQHYKRHPTESIPDIPGRIVTATELQRLERERRVTNTAVVIQPVNNLNGNAPTNSTNNQLLVTANASNQIATPVPPNTAIVPSNGASIHPPLTLNNPSTNISSNASNVPLVTSRSTTNNNIVATAPGSTASNDAAVLDAHRSLSSNSSSIPSVTSSTNSASSSADTNQVNDNTTNTTTSLDTTTASTDIPTANASASIPVATRRSVRHAARNSNIADNSQSNHTNPSNINTDETSTSTTVNESPVNDNVLHADINPGNDAALPPNNTATTPTIPAPTIRNTRRGTRRNPSLVHVQHTVNPPTVSDITAAPAAAADELNDLQDDIDLTIRRRNNIRRRRNNRHGIVRGNFDLLPSSTAELVIDENFKLELMNLSDADFEERFFGFHHPRLDSIHYSYTGPIQLLMSKLLQIIVDNNGLLAPNEAMIKCSRSAVTALNCLIMCIKCITLKREASDNNSESVLQYLTYWNQLPTADIAASILYYVSKAADFSRASAFTPRIFSSIQSVVRASEKYMHQSKYSRALSLIDTHIPALMDENNTNNHQARRWSTNELVAITAALHPTHDELLDNVAPATAAAPVPAIIISPEQILGVAKELDTTSSEGVDGWNNFHLKKVLLHAGINNNAADDDAIAENVVNEGHVFHTVLTLLAQLATYFIAGTINNAGLWSLSRLIYIPKKESNTTVRPIAVGTAIYRLIAQSILLNVTDTVGNLLSPIQIGVGIKDGGGILASSLKALTCCHEDLCLLSFDIENAFNTERRGRTAAGVAKYCPALLALYKTLYGISGSSLRSSQGELLGRSCTGVRQGDPLAMLLFCCSIQDTLLEINALLRARVNDATVGTSTLFNLSMQGSYADDLNICVPVNFAEEIFLGTMDIFETNGFKLNRAKSTIFLSGRYRDDEDSINFFFPTTGNHVVFKKRVLGVIFGSTESVQQALAADLAEIHRILGVLKHVPAHISLYLVKYCINAIPAYVHRILPPSITSVSYSTAVDSAILGAIEHMLQCPLPTDNHAMIRFPCKLDGLGIPAWHSFIPRIQYDQLQHRTIEFLQSHLDVYSGILATVSRSRQQFSNAELGFATNNDSRDYQRFRSNTRSFALFEQLHAEYLVFLRNKGRVDIITHMEHQHYPTSGLLFGMSYIRSSFIKDASLFSEALGYRLKVPLVFAPPPDPSIPPPRPYRCLHCENYRRGYNLNTIPFEHCFRCPIVSADVTHRHDATVKAIKNYILDVRGNSVQVTKGTRENTNGDRGQVCDLVISKRGQPDVKLDITYSAGVDASQYTNQSFTAPIASIVIAENNKRAHYQRNDSGPGDVIPLAFSFSGHYLGPSFIAFCNTIEAAEEQLQVVYDYNAHHGVNFARKFHPARRRLISEITRFSYLFIAKARIRSRQQLFRQEDGNGPHLHPVFAAPPYPHYASFNSLNQPLVDQAHRT